MMENNGKLLEQETSKLTLFESVDLLVYVDNEYKVRAKAKTENKDRIMDVQSLVMSINNLPMNLVFRKKYSFDIASIYKIACSGTVDKAKEFGENLKQNIENRIITYKKVEFIVPCIITVILSMVIYFTINNIAKIYSIYTYALLFGPMGGILSIAIKQNEIKIDYKVDKFILVIEGVRMIVISIIMSFISIVAVRSKVLLGNIDFKDNLDMLFLVAIIAGYSQHFVPNLLDKLGTEFSYKNKEDIN